jgi:hypothetical protein
VKSKCVFLPAIIAMISLSAFGQSTQRWAVLVAHGPAAASNPVFALAESRVTDELTAELTALPGVTLIDRASLDKVLAEQNFQNSDRSSPETAVRIGKLLGIGEMVLLQVYDCNYTTHQDQSGNTTRTMGTVVLRANAKMVEVETGIIRAEPAANFTESVEVSETTKTPGFVFGAVRVPPKQKTTGGDPTVIADNEWSKAADSVAKELASKLSKGAPVAPAPKVELALVAGIANGAVFINRGSAAGIKAGDKFQITREASVGLNDPETGKPIVQKQSVCVLTIVQADEADASGTCQGGLPEPKDVAEPLK